MVLNAAKKVEDYDTFPRNWFLYNYYAQKKRHGVSIFFLYAGHYV